jgi:hypothetical protein
MKPSTANVTSHKPRKNLPQQPEARPDEQPLQG